MNTKTQSIFDDEEKLKKAVSVSVNYAEVIEYFTGAKSGASYKSLKSRIKKYNIDTSHFTFFPRTQVRRNAARPTSNQDYFKLYSFDEKAPKNQSALLRLINDKIKKYYCEKCLIVTWNSSKISLQLHHIDGDSKNFCINNLQLLCPNCHTQTDNWGSKNVKENRVIVNYCLDCERPCSNKSLRCIRCAGENGRKVVRPSKDELITLMAQYNMAELGRMFGVTCNNVRKWVKNYDIAHLTRKIR